jgi:hypothetical protein
MDLGIVAFWLFVAAAVVAYQWRNKNSEAMRHETFRLLIEKNQRLDEAQLAALLNPKPHEAPEWLRSKPGNGYRTLRICGAITMFAALGLIIVGVWRGMLFGIYDPSVVGIATAIPLVALGGIGLFFASRFVAPPPSTGGKER